MNEGTWEPILANDYSWYTDSMLWDLAQLSVNAYRQGIPYERCMEALAELPQDRSPVRMAMRLIKAQCRQEGQAQ